MRNQSWIEVAAAAATTMPHAVISACRGEAMASATSSGAKIDGDGAEHRLDLGAGDEARRHRRGGDEIRRVLAGNRKPGEAAGKLARGHDQHRHQELIGAVPSSKLRHSSTAGGIR